MQKLIETERLTAGFLEITDAGFILKLLNSPGWLRYIGDRQVKTIEQAIAYIENGPQKSYETNGYGLLRVALKNSGQPIGICGLIKRPELPIPDLGFAYLPSFCLQGYGTEMTIATIAHAKEILHTPEVGAITLPTNPGAIRLLQKAGMFYKNEIFWSATNEVLQFFSTAAD